MSNRRPTPIPLRGALGSAGQHVRPGQQACPRRSILGILALAWVALVVGVACSSPPSSTSKPESPLPASASEPQDPFATVGSTVAEALTAADGAQAMATVGADEADGEVDDEAEEASGKRRRRRGRRSKEKPTLVQRETWQEPYYPFLADDDPEASVSVGTITDGRLVQGRILPLPSLTYRILPSTAKRGYIYGTQETIALIEDAAATFYADQKVPMVVGNISQRGGGDIRQSVSHNNGRDFDLGFCYRTSRDTRYKARKLVPLDKRGRSAWGGGQRLDTACTWSMVKALLTSKVAEIQYIFISDPLKRLLIEYAREKFEPGSLIVEARAKLLEPPKSAPHDDHMHVRIFCSVANLSQGCVDEGPRHPRAEQRQAQANVRLRAIAALLNPPQPQPEAPNAGDPAVDDPTGDDPPRGNLDQDPGEDGAAGDDLAGDNPAQDPSQDSTSNGMDEPDSDHPPTRDAVNPAPRVDTDDGIMVGAAPVEQRIRAIERLVLARTRLSAIAQALKDDEPTVRQAAALALGKLQARDYAETLHQRFASEPNGAVRAAVLRALGDLGGFDVSQLLRKLIADPSNEAIDAGPLPEQITACYTPPPGVEKPRRRAMAPPGLPHYCGHTLDLSNRTLNLRLAAIEVAADLERPEPVEPLMALLDHKDPLTRGRAARALRRLTNHSSHVPWDSINLPPVRRRRGLQDWAKWWEKRKDDHRKTWLSSGFRDRGLPVPRLEPKAMWGLVEAINYENYLSYNAQRALTRLTDHDPGSLTWPKHVATRYWTRYLYKRRGTYRLRPCPMELDRYCPLD